MKVKTNDIIGILCIFQIFCYLSMGILISYNSAFSIINILQMLVDGLIIFIIFAYKSKRIAGTKVIFTFFMFLLYMIISFTWSNGGIYNAFSRLRYIVAAFVIYYTTRFVIDSKYIIKIINLMCIAQVVNLVLVIQQAVVLGLHPDFCNGIFGYDGYHNAGQGLFCLALSILAIAYCIDGKWSILRSFFIISISCIICAFSEIKIYFVALIICFLATIFIRSKNKIKIIRTFIIVAISVWIGYKLLQIFFPVNLDVFFNLRSYISYEEYGSRAGAGRLNSISYIYDNEFNHNWVKTLFGKGLGAASFQYVYEVGKMFSDSGAIGVVLFFMFILINSLEAFKIDRIDMKRSGLLVIIFSLAMMIAFFAWNCIFTRSAYLGYFFLGLSNFEWIKKSETAKKSFKAFAGGSYNV